MAYPFEQAIRTCRACLLHAYSNPKPDSLFLCESHALERSIRELMATQHTMSDTEFMGHVKTYNALIDKLDSAKQNKLEKSYL